MTNTTTAPTTWTDHFTQFNEDIIAVNEHTNLILEISSVSNDKISKIKNLTSDKGDSILMYYSTVSKSIEFLHNLTDIGSTNWSKEPVLIAMNGLNRAKAIPVIIEIDSLFEAISTNAPTFTRLSSITDTALFDTTEAPDSHPQIFNQLPFILLPPFLWNTVCRLNDKSPNAVFISILKCIDDFTETNKNDKRLNKVTKRTCSNILTFIWAASKNKVTNIRILPAVENTNIENWSKTRHSQCLQQEPETRSATPTTNHHGLNQIAEAIELQNASFLASQSVDKSKKGFGKLDSSTKNLILNASSSNSEIAAGSATETCIDFFKQSSHGNARLHFIRSLKHFYKAQTDVSAGVITSIFNGGFTRAYDDSPSNFSTFSFPEKKIFAKHAITDCIILQLKEVSGKGLSNDDVEAALKQGIEIPTSIDSMRYSIFNIAAASKFFFVIYSLLSQALIKVHNHIIQNRTTYLSLSFQDKMFISKFLFAVDTRINLWLESCEESQMRDEVDDDLINFSEILSQVRVRNFDYKLPPSIRKVAETNKDSKESARDRSPPLKKGKYNQDDQTSTRVNNDGKIDNWIHEQDAYDKTIRNSDALKSRPKLGDTIMCHRFHSKGYCFDNCNNKLSHVNSSSLDKNTKKAYSTWVENATK